MSVSVYRETLQPMHFDFEKFQLNIEVWRSHHTDDIDPKSFKELSVEEQCEAIKHTDPHNPRRMEMVRDFVSAFNCAVQNAEQWLTNFSHTSNIAPNAVVQAVEEARARAGLSHDLVGANIDMAKAARLETELRTKRVALEGM
jgi:hypothetical protein